MNLQVVAQLSSDGKAAAQKVNALTQKKQAEIAEKSKALQGNQTKLQTGGGVMSDAARGQLEKEIERQTRELERLQQDAQAELQELQQELQNEFQKKLLPILEVLAKEKGLHFLFSGADAGLIWAEPRSRPDRRCREEARRRREGRGSIDRSRHYCSGRGAPPHGILTPMLGFRFTVLSLAYAAGASVPAALACFARPARPALFLRMHDRQLVGDVGAGGDRAGGVVGSGAQAAGTADGAVDRNALARRGRWR